MLRPLHRFSSEAIIAVVLVLLTSSSQTLFAQCPYGNCGQLAGYSCLAICDPCAEDWPYNYCFDNQLNCYMGIFDVHRKDYDGETGSPCYICGSVTTSGPLWCLP